MKIEAYIRDLLFLLFASYFAQGSLYATGTIVSQAILGLILLISMVYFGKLLLLKFTKPLFFKAWTALLILNIVGMIFTGSFGNPIHFSMFKGILLNLLPFYPFYYFARKGNLTSKHLLRFFILLLPIAILQFFTNQSTILANQESENVVNNIAYLFVGFIPFTFLFKKKWLSFVVMALLMFFIIQGAKRGAIISGALGFVIFMYFQMRTVERKNRIKGYVLSIIGLFILSYFAVDFLESNEFLLKRLESLQEGNSSGRDDIYANVFNGWYNSDNFLNLLLGFGFAGSTLLSGSGLLAHNDWLELLSNFGLVGVTMYLILFYALFKNVINKKWQIEDRLLLLAILLAWFGTTIFSMGYTSQDGYIKGILIAYLIGNRKYGDNKI